LSVLRRFLKPGQQDILNAERRGLAALRTQLADLDADAEELAVLDRALEQLDELFLLIIVGEFNAGKSAFINALLGRRLLDEGVTPTTTKISILKYGEKQGESKLEEDIAILTCPVEWLRDINIVDTPGTNAVIQRHTQITEHFIPRADLVLFVTSADRPYSESERLFLQRIREWGKKIVVILNKIDILETPADVEEVVSFVEENGLRLLGRKPVIFPIAARLARQAKETLDAHERTHLWALSRFEPVEGYILHTLDERERLRLKLSSPLGVAQRLADRYREVVEARKALLQDDVTTVQTIEGQLSAYEADMRRDFRYQLSHVDNVLYAMSERGNQFFDETIRIGRILDLLRTERVRSMFEKEVVADTAAQVETHTHELIDWMVQQDYRHWQAVMEYLNKRIARHQDTIIGQVSSGFEFNRQALLQSVGSAAREVVASYNKETEAKALAESVQLAVAQTAIVEVGAIGLGALMVKMLAASVADVSGVIAASAVAALGLYLIPNKRRRAKNNLQAKISDLRSRLSETLTARFESELGRSLQRIREAMRPYTRFVETQQKALVETESALRNMKQTFGALASKIETM
jgi:small GTP-binding protein